MSTSQVNGHCEILFTDIFILYLYSRWKLQFSLPFVHTNTVPPTKTMMLLIEVLHSKHSTMVTGSRGCTKLQCGYCMCSHKCYPGPFI